MSKPVDVIEFTIPYKIQAKQSMRARVVQPKGGGKSFVRTYQSAEVKENAVSLASLVAPHRPDKPWDCPVFVSIRVEYPFRTTESKRRRAVGWLPKTTNPDCEQLAKQILDVMEDAGFFINDARVAKLWVEKVWTDRSVVRISMHKMI